MIASLYLLLFGRRGGPTLPAGRATLREAQHLTLSDASIATLGQEGHRMTVREAE